MNLTGGIILYTMLWFLTLFVVLPFGQKSQAEAGEVVPGTPPGAPHRLRAKRKLILTTVIAAILWAGCAWLILGGVFTREDVEGWDRILRG